MNTGVQPGGGLCAAADVHYLRSGGARAAVVLAADASFGQVLAERTAVLVTAIGMPRCGAAALVQRMAGPFRVPDALRRADHLARTGQSTSADRPAS